jgi:hypothetical protein
MAAYKLAFKFVLQEDVDVVEDKLSSGKAVLATYKTHHVIDI